MCVCVCVCILTIYVYIYAICVYIYTVCVYVCMIYCKDLAHTIIETGKSQDLQAGDPGELMI